MPPILIQFSISDQFRKVAEYLQGQPKGLRSRIICEAISKSMQKEPKLKLEEWDIRELQTAKTDELERLYKILTTNRDRVRQTIEELAKLR